MEDLTSGRRAPVRGRSLAALPPAFPARQALALAALLALGGCHRESLHTRWARSGDTGAAWRQAMAAMPVNVHGNFPGLDTAQTLARIPGGTTSAGYRAAHPGAPPLASGKRLELYVGDARMPRDTHVCDAEPPLAPTADSDATRRVAFATALCDGPRLVGIERRSVAGNALGRDEVAATLSQVEQALLFGLDLSRRQLPVQTRGG